MSNCFNLKNKNQKDSLPNGFLLSRNDSAECVKTSPNASESEFPSDCKLPQVKPASFVSEGNSAMKCFDSFVHDGFISLSNDKSKAVPVRILRDTGASQSLLLGNTLPFSETSFTGSNALIKGVNCDDFASVPLHRVQLFSDLVSGEVKVGLQDSLPFEGVQFVLGNDLARSKVYAHPIVTEKPSYELNDAVNSDKIFPSCAVTRSMKKSSVLDSENNTSVDNSNVDDFSLFDTVMNP